METQRAGSAHLGSLSPTQGGSGRNKCFRKVAPGLRSGGGPQGSSEAYLDHQLPRWEEVLFGFTWRKTTHRKVMASWGCQGLATQSLTELLSTGLVVRSFSRVQFFATPWTAAHQAPPSFTISRRWLKLMSI